MKTTAPEQKWPDTIWVVRHGQSAGNVARQEAENAKLPQIDIATRDVDVPLSPLGEEQARALGRWFGEMPKEKQPTIVLYSPYVRARRTAELMLESAGVDLDDITFHVDERLREKEFGLLDRLTQSGIALKYPELHEQRNRVGKFYFRPPGGESWCDVILRLRSMLDTMTRGYRGEHVLIVAHQVVVNCFRYLFERLDEETILAEDRTRDVPNCSVTSYRFDPSLGRKGKLVPELINFVAPLEDAGASVTTAPDAPVAAKA
jgi:broad specificity phosphatase PhoE